MTINMSDPARLARPSRMNMLTWTKKKDTEGDIYWDSSLGGYTVWVRWAVPAVPVSMFVASGLEAGEREFRSLLKAIAACEADYKTYRGK